MQQDAGPEPVYVRERAIRRSLPDGWGFVVSDDFCVVALLYPSRMWTRVGQALEALAVVTAVVLLVGQAVGQPLLLGYVRTGSMQPTLDPGDGFLSVPPEVTGDPAPGDVIVYRAEQVNGGRLTTHRIVRETERGYVTQGDANPFTDQSAGEPPVRAPQIVAVGVQVGGSLVTIPGLGTAVTGLGGVTSGAQQRVPSHIWIGAGVAGLFVLLALAMFGLFDLQLPAHLRTAMENRTRRLGGSFGGAAALGMISAIVVSPCVTPPLIGALIYIADTGDPLTGGFALFALGIGMGLPLIAAAGFAGHLLPRAGPWMNRVRAAFGVLLLGVAIWLLQRVVPVPVSMVLWAVLLIVVGVQLGALASASTGWARLWKGIGLIAVLYGSILLVGATAGGQSLLQPLRGVIGGGSATQETVDFEPVEDAAELRQKLAAAQREGRPVMLDVYADWCVSCKELEAFTFPDPRVQAALEGAVLLRADVTPNDAGDKALLQRFDLYGPPAVLFFGTDGVERRGYRVVGYKGAAEFAEHTRQAFGRPETPS
mgnify:CR=1 FL=1